MANSKSHKLAKSVIGKLNFTAVFLMCAAQAHAGGTGLPWDGPIEKIAQGLSGPVAFLFALGGMVVLGVRWVFGGEMGSMTRSLLTAVAGIALLVFAADFLSGLFGVSSALILK
jgi:type IV secretory pathway VirB2 component (pilin)